MLEFTGQPPPSDHAHANGINCRPNVNAHTHVEPAYVFSCQTHLLQQLHWLGSVPPIFPNHFLNVCQGSVNVKA